MLQKISKVAYCPGSLKGEEDAKKCVKAPGSSSEHIVFSWIEAQRKYRVCTPGEGIDWLRPITPDNANKHFFQKSCSYPTPPKRWKKTIITPFFLRLCHAKQVVSSLQPIHTSATWSNKTWTSTMKIQIKGWWIRTWWRRHNTCCGPKHQPERLLLQIFHCPIDGPQPWKHFCLDMLPVAAKTER